MVLAFLYYAYRHLSASWSLLSCIMPRHLSALWSLLSWNAAHATEQNIPQCPMVLAYLYWSSHNRKEYSSVPWSLLSCKLTKSSSFCSFNHEAKFYKHDPYHALQGKILESSLAPRASNRSSRRSSKIKHRSSNSIGSHNSSSSSSIHRSRCRDRDIACLG